MSTPNDNRKLSMGERYADSVAEAEAALAQEKANQEKIGATVQAARASATHPPYVTAETLYQAEKARDTYKLQRDELLKACNIVLGVLNAAGHNKFQASREILAEVIFRTTGGWDIARATEGGTGQ